ncbi:MAG: hypothetical protein ACYCQI_12595 [Gammaproteobacteria bacterium]
MRTLRTMENYSLVKLTEGKSGKGRPPLIPEVLYSAAEIEVCLG